MMRYKLDCRLAGDYLIRLWIIQFAVIVLFDCFSFGNDAKAQEIAGFPPELEWHALKALYQSTDGDNWTNHSNWDMNRTSLPSSNSLNQWYGVTMNDDHVTELILPNNGLTGALPSQLQYLTNLQVLDLQENNLSGSISPWINSLSSLVKLRLQQNRLTGSIPTELGRLTQLEYLNLRGNALEGTIPQSIENLSRLKGLWLHNNRLMGSIPQGVIDLQNLEWLWLGGNSGLLGVITLSDSDRYNKIDFYLGETNLCIEHDDRITHTMIYECLPSMEWEALNKLFDATQGDDWINHRGWTFDRRPRADDVDQWHGVTIENGRVHALSLAQNNLNGQIPQELNAFQKLQALQLDKNPLRGTLPESITLLNNLKIFSASETRLCASDSDTFQLWLQQIPTLSGINNCSTIQENTALSGSVDSAENSVLLPIWLIATLILLGLIGTCAAIITGLYTARRLREPESIEIDQEEDKLRLIEQRIDFLIETANSITHLAEQSLNQSEITENFSSSIKSLRGALDDRDQEIKRLKKGYDSTIYRKFVIRFIRVNQAVQYFLQQSDDAMSQLESIHSLLEDALLECDVHRFTPEIGSDYRSAFGVADYPKILETDVEGDDCMIAEILEHGYYIKGGQEKEVLIPARVAIYRFNTNHH